MPKLSKSKEKSKRNTLPESDCKLSTQRFLPYARGFKAPDNAARLRALGFGKGNIPTPFDPNTPAKDGFWFFEPIPRPTSEDDWLAQYCEEGQTFQQYLRECPWLSPRKVKYIPHQFVPGGKTLSDRYPEGKIYVVQVGDFSLGKCPVPFAELVDYAERFLGLAVATLPAVSLVEEGGNIYWQDNEASAQTSAGVRRSGRIKRHTLETRHHAGNSWTQVSVDSMLRCLQARIPHDAFCLVALTMYDLYADDSDLFVAGMAAGLNRVAVFSLRRYDPRLTFSTELWHMVQATEKVSEEERQRLMVARSSRLLVHEVCHLLGLDHCVFFACAMNGSGHLSEDFGQPMHLCPVCLRKLHLLVGVDLRQRYARLCDFYARHGLRAERDWVTHRLAFLDGVRLGEDSTETSSQHKDSSETSSQHKDSSETSSEHKDSSETNSQHKESSETSSQHNISVGKVSVKDASESENVSNNLTADEV